MRDLYRIAALGIGIALVAACPGLADDKAGQSSAFETKAKSVAIFKDGYGFFIREGTAKLQGGWCTTNYIPSAVLGTLFVYTKNAADGIDMVVATGDNKVSGEDKDALARWLSDKIDLRVLAKTEKGSFDGKLTHLLQDLLLLEKDSSTTAVKLSEIKSVSLLDYPLKVKLRTGKPDAQAGVGMGYLQQGISWMPSYLLDMTGDEEGLLTLRATVTNGIEDLDGCRLFFVVGLPNYENKARLDLLTMVRRMQPEEGALYAGAAFANAPSQIMAQAQDEVARGARAGEPEEAGRPSSPEWEGLGGTGYEAMSEFFFHEKDDVTLGRGEVAMISVFTKKVACESEYEWPADTEECWHHLFVKNELDTPLTTGPVITMRDGQPLGQITLKYTPVGGRGKAYSSVASDVSTKKAEVEVERGAKEVYSARTYIPVLMKGTLTVENHRADDIKIEIRRTVLGSVPEATDAGEVAQSETVGLNTSSVIKWKITVPANSTKSVEYTYTKYVEAKA
jgi:hypothetical protein